MLRALVPVPQVRYLKIIEKSGYQALPWVRYITQNGGACSPFGGRDVGVGQGPEGVPTGPGATPRVLMDTSLPRLPAPDPVRGQHPSSGAGAPGGSTGGRPAKPARRRRAPRHWAPSHLRRETPPSPGTAALPSPCVSKGARLPGVPPAAPLVVLWGSPVQPLQLPGARTPGNAAGLHGRLHSLLWFVGVWGLAFSLPCCLCASWPLSWSFRAALRTPLDPHGELPSTRGPNPALWPFGGSWPGPTYFD